MQLAGPGVFGPPKDKTAAVAVLREAVEAGVNHIDTSDYYGPHVVNELIHEALFPYPEGPDYRDHGGRAARRRRLVAAGAVCRRARERRARQPAPPGRGRAGRGGISASWAWELSEGSIEPQFTALAELQRQGLIRHLGVSNATSAQVAEARAIAPVVCVQNRL